MTGTKTSRAKKTSPVRKDAKPGVEEGTRKCFDEDAWTLRVEQELEPREKQRCSASVSGLLIDPFCYWTVAGSLVLRSLFALAAGHWRVCLAARNKEGLSYVVRSTISCMWPRPVASE